MTCSKANKSSNGLANMEKVYVLTKVTKANGYHGYDDTKVVGVFFTLKSLCDFEKANPLPSWDRYDYEEFEVQ